MEQLSYRFNPAIREQALIRDAKKSETSAQRAFAVQRYRF